VRDPKTIEVLELRVGYIKDRFGKLCRQDIKRPDVLAFMRSYEAEGKLETRDRVRSIGEQICDYADVEGDGYNPFRNLNGQMIANISTPRPGVTEPRDPNVAPSWRGIFGPHSWISIAPAFGGATDHGHEPFKGGFMHELLGWLKIHDFDKGADWSDQRCLTSGSCSHRL
jgi:hypothetical protein